MWLRNIIWFVLLTGIIILSILFFLMIMNPASAPNYTTNNPSTNTPGVQNTHEKNTIQSTPGQTIVTPIGKSGGGWILFARYVGYIPVLMLLIPIFSPMLLAKRRKNSSTAFSTFYTGSLLFLGIAAIHGAILLRLVHPFNFSLFTGSFLYFFSILFLIRLAFLYFATLKLTRWKIGWPIGLILLVLVIHLIW